MRHVLVTGFPGFLGSALVRGLLGGAPPCRVTALVQPDRMEQARREREALAVAGGPPRRRPATAGRDEKGRLALRASDLAAGTPLALDDDLRDVTRVVHLAAVYDLAVPRGLAEAVNVGGTRRVLELCASLPHLEALDHVSTCYVSGRHPGVFGEADLDVGQRFNNHYEETKFRAEVAVRRALAEGLPGRVIRPAVVVGDSGTGATRKYDGPYYVLRHLLGWPRHAVLAVPGDPGATRFNAVPRDWVLAAMETLAADPDTLGGTFHLADPRPSTVAELLDVMARVTHRRIHRVRLPRGVIKAALRIPLLGSWAGMPAEIVDYFTHPTRYGTERTEKVLAGRVGPPPGLATLLPAMSEFVARHPEPPAMA